MTQTFEEAGMEELLNKGRRSGHVSAAEVLAAIPEAEGSRERLSAIVSQLAENGITVKVYNDIDRGPGAVVEAARRIVDEVVGIGSCSGAKTDKFAKFGLTRAKAKHVGAPLVAECLANIECRVVDIVQKHNIVVLDGVAAWVDEARKERRTLHAVGDGTFIVGGRRLDRRRIMRSKIPVALR